MMKVQGMIATGNHASGNRWLPESFLHRLLVLGMMSDIATSLGEHKSDQRCIDHAERKMKQFLFTKQDGNTSNRNIQSSWLKRYSRKGT